MLFFVGDRDEALMYPEVRWIWEFSLFCYVFLHSLQKKGISCLLRSSNLDSLMLIHSGWYHSLQLSHFMYLPFSGFLHMQKVSIVKSLFELLEGFIGEVVFLDENCIIGC